MLLRTTFNSFICVTKIKIKGLKSLYEKMIEVVYFRSHCKP